MFRASTAVIATCVLMAACGGGGGSPGGPGTPQAVNNAAVGGWVGTTADGDDINVAVLESGEVWGLVVDGSAATAVFHAPTSSTTGSAFQANQAQIYPFGARTSSAASLTGAVNASTLSGTATGPGVSFGFNLARAPGYNIQATLAPLAGVWNGSYGSLSGVESISNVTISATGTLLAVDGTCTISGSFQTRPGTALYDVTLSYRMAAGCTSDLTVRGIALLSDAGNELDIGLIHPDRRDAALVHLRKSGT